MTLDGFWIVKFTAAQVYGSGVVVFSNGKIFGGETGFYYLGTYEAEGRIVKARIIVRNFDCATPNGFGIAGDYEMDVSATLQDDRNANGTAVVSGHPQYNLGIRLVKKADL